MSTELIKLKATADILGGDVFFATDAGADPENPSNDGLLANGMYIRLNGSDGSVAYISAFELDKALGIIGDMSMGKANASDVTVLQQELADRATKTELELLQGDVNTKASKSDVDNLLDIFDGKADQTSVDEIIAILNEKASQEYAESIMSELESKAAAADVDNLTVTVTNKADKATVVQLLADVQALQETVQLLTSTDSIAAINAQIAYLNSEIVKRLTIDDLRSLNTSVSDLQAADETINARLDVAEVNLNKKATTTYVQGQVNELNTAITALAGRVDNKADRTELTSKANKSDLDNVVRKATELGVTVEDLEIVVDNNYNEIVAGLNRKAVKDEVDASIASINADLQTKADTSSFNTEVNRLDNKINTLEESHSNRINSVSGSIEELECEVNNTLSELRATLNNQNKTLTNQGTQLTRLQESSGTYADQLKQTWVRVLTSTEYKKLTNPPEGVPYNPRYKYPNTVYLVVDFNKPKAIYIGDILVAQSEQKGSIGFAYTFPIIF